MNESAIPVRYAKALYLTARDKNTEEGVLKDLLQLDQYFSELPDFAFFVESPVIAESVKLAFIDQIDAGFEELTSRFLHLITKNKREKYIRRMIHNFLRFYRKDKGILEATLFTAGEIKKQTLQDIKQALKKAYQAEIDLQQKTDAELIGGFVLRIDDKQLDASIANQLQTIKRELNQTTITNID